MRVSEFRALKNCEKNFKFNKLVDAKDKRPLLMTNAIVKVAELLEEKADMIRIEKEVSTVLDYKSEWFETEWLAQTFKKDDISSILRFVGWFLQQNLTVVRVNVNCTYISEKRIFPSIADKVLSQNVSLICKGEKGFTAFIISRKKPNHSPGGKSLLTNTTTQPEVLVAKTYLEREYPNIKVGMIHLRTELDEDGSLYPDFLVGKTKKSTLLFADFKDYEEENGSTELLQNKLTEVVNTPVVTNCFGCKNANLCKGRALKRTCKASEEHDYVLPEYTEEQKGVINSHNGPMVVCAGPGSGKTATVVGRVKSMMDSGILPENILVITYTKKAAEELLERISSFTENLPFIMTINSLGDSILKQNKEYIGREVKVLTPAAKRKIIKNLLMALPERISGFKYGSLYGRYGLLQTVERKLDLYFQLGDYESFRRKEPKLKEDFYNFAELYGEVIRENGYITYDEQITLTVKLFREHPEILSAYQELFKYIMVDEFQDVNKDNAEFIYLITDKYENICVVGDDDQAIFGFRGGDSAFMLHFPERYPKAKTLMLSTNFRSCEGIVKLAANLVAQNVRIPKDIKAARGEGKISPRVVNGNSTETIERLIKNLVDKYEYSYGDIAVLSTKNAPLQELKDSLSVPCELAKTYLVNDPFFTVVQNVLSLYYKGLSDNECVYSLFSVLYPSEASMCQRSSEQSLYDTIRGVMPDINENRSYYFGEGEGINFVFLSQIAFAFNIIDAYSNLKELVKALARLFECEGVEAVEAICSLIDERAIQSKREMAEHFEFMVLSEDDARVDVAPSDAVMLSTTHDSKGKEWPCVILQNGEEYSSEEESRRLLYVACTRAKDVLLVCHRENTTVNLGTSLPEMATLRKEA